MSSFEGEHLRRVVKALLPMPCHAQQRDLVNAKPSEYRVHTVHFRAEDKVPGQGGHLKLKATALPIPFSQLPLNDRNVENVNPNTLQEVAAHGATQITPPRAPLAPIPVGDVQRRTLGLTGHNLSSGLKRRRLALPSRGTSSLLSPTTTTSNSRPQTPATTTISLFLPPSPLLFPSVATRYAVDPQSHVPVLLQRAHSSLQTEKTLSMNRAAMIQELKAKIAELEKQVQDEKQARVLAETQKAEMWNLLVKAREEAKAAIDALIQLQSTTNLKVNWNSVTKEGSCWNDVVMELTGVCNGKVLEALYDWVNWNGQAERLRYWNGKQTIKRLQQVMMGTTMRKSVGRKLKALSPRDALVATLVKLRTGLSTRVISSWTGIAQGTLGRVFVTWISFLDSFFKSEFPCPPVDAMQGKDTDD